MRLIPLAVCTLLLQVPAKADKFWLSDPEAEKNASAGSSPNVIEGVLLAEDAEGYHVRVVGGEVLLPKKAVFRIDKDGLTLDAVVKAEAGAAQAREAADQERQMAQAAARRASAVKAMEASARRSDAPAPAAAPVSVVPGVQYDPILDVVPARGAPSHSDLLRDLQLAYNLTKDRRYLKVLRQARRLN